LKGRKERQRDRAMGRLGARDTEKQRSREAKRQRGKEAKKYRRKEDDGSYLASLCLMHFI